MINQIALNFVIVLRYDSPVPISITSSLLSNMFLNVTSWLMPISNFVDISIKFWFPGLNIFVLDGGKNKDK